KIEGAIAAGIYDRGLETVSADSLVVESRRTIFTHPASGATTSIVTIRRKDRNRPVSLEAAMEEARRPGAKLLVNERSGRAAVQVPAPGLVLDDGTVEARVRLNRPLEQHGFARDAIDYTSWQIAGPDAF